MKEPKFWYKHTLWSPVIRFVLKPFGHLYTFVAQYRLKHGDQHYSLQHQAVMSPHLALHHSSFPFPLIIIGNITLGGSGKTPTALWLGQALQKKNIPIMYLTKGYKGSIAKKTIQLLNKQYPSATQHKTTTNNLSQKFGDEAVLLSQHAKTMVGYNRKEALQYIVNHQDMLSPIQAIISDDGLQNPYMPKAFRILVMDLHKDVTHAHIFPAGPLRESLQSALQRCHMIIAIGDPLHHPSSLQTIQQANRLHKHPLFFARIRPIPHPKIPIHSKVLAFCGIANPHKFKKSLTEVGYHVQHIVVFKDHHSYSIKDMEQLMQTAKNLHVPLITTEKDKVKIPDPYHTMIYALHINLEVQDAPSIVNMIKDYINSEKKSASVL